ncbi:MAG: hypothetical protein K2I69_07505 [Muribaculaceae bacterium]|nr:hypothetical protein [Muribaculaceae bacterium]
MTDKEREDYNNLKPSLREDYDYEKKKHPNWSHAQIMAKIAIGESLGETVEKGGGTIDATELENDPKMLKEVLEGAKRVLIEAGVFIYAVFDVLDSAISLLGNMVMCGVKYVGNKLSEFWDWLTS